MRKLRAAPFRRYIRNMKAMNDKIPKIVASTPTETGALPSPKVESDVWTGYSENVAIGENDSVAVSLKTRIASTKSVKFTIIQGRLGR
jgi:hypothetical protein